MTTHWARKDVVTFALSLAGAHAGTHQGKTDYRVRDRIFLSIPRDVGSVVLKTTPVALDMLVRSDPLAFRDAWGGRWIEVRIDCVPPDKIRDLVLDAYGLAARG